MLCNKFRDVLRLCLIATVPPTETPKTMTLNRTITLCYLTVWQLIRGTCIATLISSATILAAPPSTPRIQNPPAANPHPNSFDANRAFGYLKTICKFGNRMSGSRGMARQQGEIARHFTGLGAKVYYQSFDVQHPLDGTPVRMNNIVVSWHPESRQRVLIACHYDTRPYPDADRVNPRGSFVGANDGASGVALLMELGNHMQDVRGVVGVDFVFFDGEELVYGDRGKYFHGSEHFATEYRDRPPQHRYTAGVVIDMVGDRKLGIYREKSSMKLAPDVTNAVWRAAAELGVSEFIDEEKHEVNDDHLPLNKIARIPTCDIIDFDYPHWHTTRDVPAQCSGESLAKVARVLVRWIESIPGSKEHP